MSGAYDKRIGRVRLRLWAPQDGGTVDLVINDGWTEEHPEHTNRLHVEELRDLRYLIDRALAVASPPTSPDEG